MSNLIFIDIIKWNTIRILSMKKHKREKYAYGRAILESQRISQVLKVAFTFPT
jgi:hypothetical protein